MNKGVLLAIAFVIVIIGLMFGLRDGIEPEPASVDEEVANVVDDMQQLQDEHMEADTWEKVDSANEKLQSFNQQAKNEAEAFLKLPHIASATGQLAEYRELFRDEFQVLEFTEPRRLEIEGMAKEFDQMDIASYAAEKPQEYLQKVGKLCSMLKTQEEDTLKHLDYGKSRRDMLKDPEFFKEVFLDQLTYENGMAAMDQIVANRERVYQSWAQTYQDTDCAQVAALGIQ